MKRATLLTVLIVASVRLSLAQDPGWPREMTKDGARLVYYQPQVDDWKNFKELDFRLAVSLTPAGGKAVVGVVSVHAQTDVNVDARTVLIHNLTISETRFPSLEAEAAARMATMCIGGKQHAFRKDARSCQSGTGCNRARC